MSASARGLIAVVAVVCVVPLAVWAFLDLRGLDVSVGMDGVVVTARQAAPTEVPTTWLVERRTSGGLCPEGACFSVLTVDDSGSWVLETEAGEESGGLDPGQRSSLEEAVASTRLAEAVPDPDGTCASSYDGTDFTYAWHVDGEEGSASTCGMVLPDADPLVEALEDLAAEVGAPAAY